MTTKNNVISLEYLVTCRVEDAIINALSNGAGKWVGQHVLFAVTDGVAPPNLNIMQIINQMVATRSLEKSFQTVNDKFARPFQLPLYRLPPKYLVNSQYDDY